MKLLVTGSSGLIGSEVCKYFGIKGHEIHGLDNNQRAVFFGALGDTTWNLERLREEIISRARHYENGQLRTRFGIVRLVPPLSPAAVSI